MKQFGSSVAFIPYRNREIMKIYSRLLAESDTIFMPKIFRKIADSPASRFWVSPERAAIVISEILRFPDGWKNKIKTKTKQEMFEEIFRRYSELQSRMPRSSIIEIATIVVHQPAPKFYFTPRTIGEFVSRIRNGYYERLHL